MVSRTLVGFVPLETCNESIIATVRPFRSTEDEKTTFPITPLRCDEYSKTRSSSPSSETRCSIRNQHPFVSLPSLKASAVESLPLSIACRNTSSRLRHGSSRHDTDLLEWCDSRSELEETQGSPRLRFLATDSWIVDTESLASLACGLSQSDELIVSDSLVIVWEKRRVQ